MPQPLVDQLAEGAALVLPVGEQEDGRYQKLLRITNRGGEQDVEFLLPVRFVPMTGIAESGPDSAALRK